MAEYQLLKNPDGSLRGILRRADRAFIPLDPTMRDYVEYLAWVAEGNTPDPAD